LEKQKGKTIMDAEFLDAIDKTADTSFDASAPTNSTGKPITCPVVLNLGPPSGRAGNDDEKRGAWQLQTEYLTLRLGKDAQENGRLWNTVLWINKHYVVTRTPAEAMPSLNIYVPDPISQSTGAPTGLDDEAPDPKDENEGIRVTNINFAATDKLERPIVTGFDKKGKSRIYALDINASGYDLLRLVDELNEIDKLAALDIDDLVREAPPLLPQADFPDAEQRAESTKIILILMTQMRTLWHPVISAIDDHATMASLARGKGKDVAAAVGRQRAIEGLRIADSIRGGLAQRERIFSMYMDILDGLDKRLPKPVRAPEGHYRNMARGPVIKLPVKPPHANDNFRAADVAIAA
jgi:hypothetical protein